jgi:hypothetical protein
MSITSHQQFTTSFAGALAKVDHVLETLEGHNIKVSPSSSVGSLFAKVRHLNKQHAINPRDYDSKKFFASIEALWIAEALEMAIGIQGSREAIRRIIGSEMDISSRKSSQGKDALWELDVYRRLKLGGADPRFEEPDLVIPFDDGLGDYGIACKKVYSESGVAGALEYGCSQLKKAGLPGVVAFNLDELMEEKAVLHAPTKEALLAEVERRGREFISHHVTDFQRTSERGGCDGVMLSISIVYEIPNGSPPISLARIPILYSLGAGCSEPVRARLAAFQRYIDQTGSGDSSCRGGH